MGSPFNHLAHELLPKCRKMRKSEVFLHPVLVAREREASDASTFHLDWQENQKSAKGSVQRCYPDHRWSSFASGTRAPAALLFYYRESIWNEPPPCGGFLPKNWMQSARQAPPFLFEIAENQNQTFLLIITVEYDRAELVIAVLSAASFVGIYQILGWIHRPGGVQGSPLTNVYEQERLQISETKSFQVRRILKVHLHKRELEINTFSQHPQKQRSSCWKSVLSSGK